MLRFLCKLAIILTLTCSPVLAASAGSKAVNDGVFTSVTGKVQAKKGSKKSRNVKIGTTVKAGDRITTSDKASAILHFFDGSELKISPKTQFTIARLEKNGLKDKILKFKLALGDLWASVTKLTSSNSSFEIESGGVVCGVRGTKYSYHYDPATHLVTVHVEEGTVYINSDGHTYIFTAGQTATFVDGKPQTNPGQSNNKGGGGSDNGNDGQGSLADLNRQFGDGLGVNGDNTFTDPSVDGSVKVKIGAVVPPAETVP